MSSQNPPTLEDAIHQIPINDIDVPQDPDRFRPGEEAIDELAASISDHGLLQPILIAEIPGSSSFDLIAGQRRLLACARLGHTKISARIIAVPPGFDTTLRLVENIQRLDLTPLEEAVSIKRMRKSQDLTQEQVAEKLAKGVSWIKSRESLLRLPDDVMDALHHGLVNPSVALQLGRIDDDEARPYYLQSAIDYGATQKVAEAWVSTYERDGAKASTQDLETTADNYRKTPGGHKLPCHVCELTFPIPDLRNVFACPACFAAVAGAARNVSTEKLTH